MYLNLNPFHAAGFFEKPLKTSENLIFCDVFRGYRKRSVAWNGWFILWVRASSRDQYQVWQWMFHLGIISRFGELYSSGCCWNWFDLYDFFSVTFIWLFLCCIHYYRKFLQKIHLESTFTYSIHLKLLVIRQFNLMHLSYSILTHFLSIFPSDPQLVFWWVKEE